MSLGKENEVKVEKIIKAPVSRVFKALAEGRLLFNCSGNSNTSTIDFRSGGKYRVDFTGHGISAVGEFLEIVPDRKIVFSWGQPEGARKFDGTRVTIELFPEGDKTKLVLTHVGFKDRELANDHDGGWSGSIGDFADELEKGRIRMVRIFDAKADALYQACSDLKRFLGGVADVSKGSSELRVGGKYQFPTEKGDIHGEFLEIEPGKKIVLSWHSSCGMPRPHGTRLTLLFSEEEDSSSSLELLHEGLDQEEAIASHRKGWDYVVDGLAKKLST